VRKLEKITSNINKRQYCSINQITSGIAANFTEYRRGLSNPYVP